MLKHHLSFSWLNTFSVLAGGADCCVSLKTCCLHLLLVGFARKLMWHTKSWVYIHTVRPMSHIWNHQTDSNDQSCPQRSWVWVCGKDVGFHSLLVVHFQVREVPGILLDKRNHFTASCSSKYEGRTCTYHSGAHMLPLTLNMQAQWRSCHKALTIRIGVHLLDGLISACTSLMW